MKSKVFILILASILIFSCFTGFFLVENCNAMGTTIYVDDDNTAGPWDGTQQHPYQYIQDGIDNANSGDTVYVYSGEYNKRIDVDKSITLQGHSKYNTVVSSYGVLEITANSVTLEGFTIGTEDTICALRVYANYSNIIGNIIGGDSYISITNRIGNVINDNSITSSFIDLEFCSDTTITNNNMVNNNIEVSFQPIRVSGCSSGIVISGNNLEDVDYGISVSGTNSVTITDNTIKNIGYSGSGVYLSSSNNGIISENIIQGIPRYGYGIKLSYSSNNNQIYGNTFISESKGEYAYDECSNFWHNPSTSRGNYWDNYRGMDSNGDGIGDTPYNISGGDNQDMYPLGYFNNPPDKPSNPYPPDGAINVEIIEYSDTHYTDLWLEVDVSDPDGDKLIVCFYDASDDSLIGSCYLTDSDKTITKSWWNISYNTTYSWYVVVNDGYAIMGDDYPYAYYPYTSKEFGGLETTSDIWTFATQSEPQENKRPIADAGGPYFGYVNTLVTFNGSGSFDSDGTITMYTWDFGDGTESGHGISPTHIYSNTGTYTVCLAVVDNNGWAGYNYTTVTITDVDEVEHIPVADADGPYSGYVNSSITFNASKSYDLDGFIVLYAWDFGDGNTRTGMSPNHTYNKAGNYTVTLVVTDNQSLTDTNTTTVTILKEKPIDTPGFELILVIVSITFILLWTRKN